MKIHLGSVNITEKTKQLLNEALDSGIVSQGKYTRDFEVEIERRFDVKHARAVASGTAADSVVLAVAKYLSPGRDEVILPALTFIAHLNAVYYNHLKPVFVDVGPDFQIDVSQVEAKITSRTLAIMPVNLLGGFCDIDRVIAIARKHDIWALTDDCEAFGSKYNGKAAGTIAEAGTFSFFSSHTICCGEGGMVVTNNDRIAELAVAIRNHGRKGDRVEDKFTFPWIGFNAKMNSMEAIVGLGALDHLDAHIERRRKNYRMLRDGLGVDLLPDANGAKIAHHCFPILFKSREMRDRILAAIFETGIECRRLYSSLPTEEESYRHLGYKHGDFPVAEDLSGRGLFLPIHQNLTDEDIEYMISAIQPLLL